MELIHRLGGPLIRRQEIPGFQDNSDKMRQCHLPTLIIHGTNDRIIPLADSEALLDLCCSADKNLVKIVGAGHNNLLMVGPNDYYRNLNVFIGRIKESGKRVP